MSEPVAVAVNNLRKTYHRGMLRRRGTEALGGVTFEVARGEIFGLLGPNGAGKTTMIKVLLGIVRKSAGEASLLGRPAGDVHARKQVGFLPEGHRIPRHHTGNSALMFFGRLSGMSGHELRVRRDEMLDLVGLRDWGKVSIKRYSKGMQQRLGMAQAMLHDPDLLILDEPTDGVDPVGRKDIRNVLGRLKDSGKTVFLNSHLLQEVELICDRVAIMARGTLRREGTVKELTQQHGQLVLRLYGTEAAIRQALSQETVDSCIEAGEGRYEVQVATTSQNDSDRIVDQLRAADISIVSLSGRQQTLEEAFLEIVSTEPVSL